MANRTFTVQLDPDLDPGSADDVADLPIDEPVLTEDEAAAVDALRGELDDRRVPETDRALRDSGCYRYAPRARFGE